MSKLGSAISELSSIEEQAGEKTWINQMHPLVKLVVTVVYTILVVSFGKYDLSGIFTMVIYPLIFFIACNISLQLCLKRIKVVMPVILIMGICNPLLDRSVVCEVYGIQITGGVISMLTLVTKGVLTVAAVYLFVVTTTMDKICNALRAVHIPEIIVSVVALSYRYLYVLLKETDKIVQAYSLRAPNQKGINIRSWGSLVGLLLLRSIDRATAVYESMNLRGYGMSQERRSRIRKEKFRGIDFIWLSVWLFILIVCRYFDIFGIVGRLLEK